MKTYNAAEMAPHPYPEQDIEPVTIISAITMAAVLAGTVVTVGGKLRLDVAENTAVRWTNPR